MVWCWWRMKWNGSLGYYPGICTEGLRKTTKTSVRVTSVPAGIRPGDLSNIHQNHSRLRQLDVFRNSFFSDITPYCPSEVNGRFEEIHRLLATCFITGFFPGLLHDTKNGGNMFLRKFSWLSTALHPRRQNCP
jgi:hypothetical protein